MKPIEKVHKDLNNKERTEMKLASFDFLARVNSILARMRETDIGIIQTKPTDTENKVAVMKVEFPPEGGVYTYYEGMDFPTKGFCFGETVETVDMVKKIVMGMMKAFYDSLGVNKFKSLLFLFFFRKQFQKLGSNLVREFDYSLSRIRQKPERYCLSGREIYRVFNLFIKWYKEWEIDLTCMRNLTCMVWEYDDAYRYTFQDVFAEFDKEKGKKNIVKELSRVLDLISEREITETESGKIEDTRTAFKFQKIKRLLFLLNFVPKTKEFIKRFFLELDLDRIKMDEADRYHASQKWGYNWRYKKEENNKENIPILQKI